MTLLPALLPLLLGAGYETESLNIRLHGVENVTATGSTSARSLKDRFAEVINVKDYGAVGDWNGSSGTDDTDAIFAALEAANGVAAGTWATGGDTSDTARKRRALFFPSGRYRITRTIPVRFGSVGLVGPEIPTVGGGTWAGHAAELVADFNGDAIAVNTNFAGVGYFGIKNLSIARSSGKTSGHGVSITGSQWVRGFHFQRCTIRGHPQSGIYVDANGVGVAGTTSDVRVEGCALNANGGYGFASVDHLTNSVLRDNLITQNTTGGVYTAGKGLIVDHNDLEGQPSPLTVAGTNNTKITVTNNYFEAHTAGTAAIFLSLVHGAVIEGNQWGPNVTIPQIVAQDSDHVRSDDVVVARGLMSPFSPKGFTTGTTLNVNDAIQIAQNMSTASPQALAFVDAAAASSVVVFHDGTSSTWFGERYRRASLVPPGASSFVTTGNGSMTIAQGEVVVIDLAVKYTATLPTTSASCLFVIEGHDGASWEPFVSVGVDASDQNTITVGDTILFTVGGANYNAKTYSQVRLKVYPYGNSAAYVGTGAFIGTPIARKVSALGQPFQTLDPTRYPSEEVFASSVTAIGASGFTFTSGVTDGASAVASIEDTENAITTSGGRLKSWRNDGVEKAAISLSGSFVGDQFIGTDFVASTGNFYTTGGNTGASLAGNRTAADTNPDVVVRSQATRNADTRILSVQNNATELANVMGDGSFYFSGYIDGPEIADPAAPLSNRGRLYFRDNGAGKTQLVVRFPTGAVQVIATEP